jgi:hypothetical protein
MRRSVNPHEGKTINRRAVCGKSARTVRREGRSKPMDLPYPYPHHVLPGSHSDHKFIFRVHSRRSPDRQADRFALKRPESRTPAILLDPFDQSGANRVQVHVVQLLVDLLSTPDVESVGLRLPDHDPFGLVLEGRLDACRRRTPRTGRASRCRRLFA